MTNLYEDVLNVLGVALSSVTFPECAFVLEYCDTGDDKSDLVFIGQTQEEVLCWAEKNLNKGKEEWGKCEDGLKLWYKVTHWTGGPQYCGYIPTQGLFFSIKKVDGEYFKKLSVSIRI